MFSIYLFHFLKKFLHFLQTVHNFILKNYPFSIHIFTDCRTQQCTTIITSNTYLRSSMVRVFVDRPTLRASMAQGLFLGGTGRRAVAHTRPEFPKMPTAPSAFPLLGAPQAPGDKPNLPEGSKSLGGRPPEAVGNTPQAPRHTRPDPRPDSTAGQSATQHLERSRPRAICRQTDLCRTGPAWSGLMLTDRVGIYEQT